MPPVSGEIIVAELRWATLKPASRKYSTLDPMELITRLDDLSGARAAVVDWLLTLAEKAYSDKKISAAEVAAWRARLGVTTDPSPAATRRARVDRVAHQVADALRHASPSLVAPRPLMRIAVAPSAAEPTVDERPRSNAERQRAHRQRRRAEFERARRSLRSEAHRVDVLTPQVGEHPAKIDARLEAADAVAGGTASDAAAALERLYEVLNNREDLGAATAARWSAELYTSNDPVRAYVMFNSEHGVVVRHAALAVDRQVDWTSRTMHAAYRRLELRSAAPSLSQTIKIRHRERFAHSVLTRSRVNKLPVRPEDWHRANVEISALTRDTLDGALDATDPAWLAVVLQRLVELVMVGRANGLIRPDGPELVHSVRATSQLLTEFGAVLPDLRLAQLHRLRAAAGVVLRVPDLVADSLERGEHYAQDLPGQLAQLGVIRRDAEGRRLLAT